MTLLLPAPLLTTPRVGIRQGSNFMTLPPLPLSVLLVDRSPPVRSHLRAVLNQEPSLCLAGEADTCAAALDLFIRYRPEAVLVEVCLPDGSGFDILQCIRQVAPDCAVILLCDAPDPCVDEVGRLLGATRVCDKAGGIKPIRDILCRLAEESRRPESNAPPPAGP